MNKKGFTLIELLVVMFILGIVTTFSIPLIRNIQTSNRTKKLTVYEDSLISSAKVYADSYSEDMFGNASSGCRDITFVDMKNKLLFKDIQDTNLSCGNSETYVRIIKNNDKYTYEVHVSCTNNDGQVVYVSDKISDKTLTCEG